LADESITLNSVKAPLTYVSRQELYPITYQDEPGKSLSDRRASYDSQLMNIFNGRAPAYKFNLDNDGFVLCRHETMVTNYFNANEVKKEYSKEIHDLVKNITGASFVHVFDHTIRTSDDNQRLKEKAREPVQVVHNDYTESSATKRVIDLLPRAKSSKLLSSRFAVVQVWRPIKGVVRKLPLAICNSRSLSQKDFVVTQLVLPNRKGEFYQVRHNPLHEWFFFPYMTSSEVLLFKGYDSEKDGRARFTAHSAFEDPTSTLNAPERLSIESRTFIFFD
tara:strand:+ start:11769 stop:12599 length:831 start_codon:yes stop_codon:yes gene_type:complete